MSVRGLARALVIVAVHGPLLRAQADSRRVLISAWLSNDSLSRAAADSVASALEREVQSTPFITISGPAVERQLAGHWDAGPGPLSVSDVRELAKLTRADMVVELSARAVAEGIELAPRRVRLRATLVDTLASEIGPSLQAVAHRLAARLARDGLQRQR